MLFSDAVSEGLEEIMAALQSGLESGAPFTDHFCILIRKPMDFRLAAAGIVGLMDSLCRFHFQSRGAVDSAQIAETMHAILSNGLLAK